MIYIVVFGTILALTGIVVYITGVWKKKSVQLDVEKEKAAQINQAALDKIAALEKEKLRLEYEQRKQDLERVADELGDDLGLVDFYPRLHKDPDKNGPN